MGRDACVGAVCLVGSGVLYCTLGLIEDERAAIFPRVLIVAMAVLSALLLVQGLLLKRKAAAPGRAYPWGRFFFLFGLIVAYFALMESLGFYVSAFLFFLAVAFILCRAELTGRKAGFRVLGSAIFVAVLYVLFNLILVVQTPRGLLF